MTHVLTINVHVITDTVSNGGVIPKCDLKEYTIIRNTDKMSMDHSAHLSHLGPAVVQVLFFPKRLFNHIFIPIKISKSPDKIEHEFTQHVNILTPMLLNMNCHKKYIYRNCKSSALYSAKDIENITFLEVGHTLWSKSQNLTPSYHKVLPQRIYTKYESYS